MGMDVFLTWPCEGKRAACRDSVMVSHGTGIVMGRRCSRDWELGIKPFDHESHGRRFRGLCTWEEDRESVITLLECARSSPLVSASINNKIQAATSSMRSNMFKVTRSMINDMQINGMRDQW